MNSHNGFIGEFCKDYEFTHTFLSPTSNQANTYINKNWD